MYNLSIKELKIEEVKVGQELAQSITNKKGQQILPPGTIILNIHLVLFQKLGIESIKINIYEPETQLELNQNTSVDTIELLKSRIDWSPIIEQEADLIKLAQLTILEKIG